MQSELGVGILCEESGGSVLLKQVKKKSLSISAFSSSVLVTELPCVRAGIELHFYLDILQLSRTSLGC